uniref:Apple domain-containing protein n=1 Tax=Haemonchus contortus TaxID=6289 RepID=W6NNI1_HAECO
MSFANWDHVKMAQSRGGCLKMCVDFPECTYVGMKKSNAEYQCTLFYYNANPPGGFILDTTLTFYRLQRNVSRVGCPLAKDVFPL